MRLYIIRHGNPNYDLDCLSVDGRIEAEALGEYLAYIGVDKIFCSPLGRAKETAEITSRLIGKDIVILDWVRELSGLRLKSSKDLPSWDIAGQEVRIQEYLNDPNRWELICDFPDIERIKQAYDMLVRESDTFLAKLGYERDGQIYRINQPNELKVAIFCHMGFGLTWLAHLLAIPLPLMWAGFMMHTTSITTVLFDQRVSGIATPRCIGLGDIPHLYHRKIQPGLNGVIANYY